MEVDEKLGEDLIMDLKAWYGYIKGHYYRNRFYNGNQRTEKKKTRP